MNTTEITITKELTQQTLIRDDGTTTCCNAYTSIFMDDGVEYCKACFSDIEGFASDYEVAQ